MACMGACMQVKFNRWRGLDAWPVDSLVGERHVVDNALGWGWGHPSTSTCQIGHTTPMQHSPGAAERVRNHSEFPYNSTIFFAFPYTSSSYIVDSI